MRKTLYTRTSFFVSLLLAFVVVSPISAQFSRAKLDSIKNQLRLLEMTRDEVESLLLPGSFQSSSGEYGQIFYREDETIGVHYSTGKCSLPVDVEFMPSDAWKAAEGTLVRADIEPKDQLEPMELGIDLSQLKRERPYRRQKYIVFYFDKDLGIAVEVRGGIVDRISFFPSRTLTSRLCDSDPIKKYFRRNKWSFIRQPKDVIVDPNSPPRVVEVQIEQIGSRKVSVAVKAEDPENDVLSYLYKVSAGRIVGTGSKVVWDLTGLRPGTYTITAAADDGSGPRGRYITKSFSLF